MFTAELIATVADDNNREVDEYEFQWYRSWVGDWETFNSTVAPATDTPSMGPACGAGLAYSYRVRAHNEGGWSGWSNVWTVVAILHDPPDPECP